MKSIRTSSIRKRLLISNILMVVIPFLLFVIAVFSLQVFYFNSGDHISWRNDHSAVSAKLLKQANLTPDKLTDPAFLSEINEELNQKQTSLAILKGNETIYLSPGSSSVKNSDLPAFGSTGPPFTRIGHDFFSLKQLDFYYPDGEQGSIFLLQDANVFSSFKTFIPILLGVILIGLIATNGFLTYFVSRSIIKPVNQLSRAAKKISTGELDFTITSHKNDELGKLSETFEDMRKKLKESTELQRQYENNRKELLANISHDLKTPITSIKGHVEGIMDGVANTPEKTQEYIKVIFAKSKELDHLIDELFLYSKLDLNKITFHFETINIRAYLQDFIEELTFDYQKDGVTFALEAEANDPYLVNADRDQLKRVLINIVGNSLKYLDKENKKIKLIIIPKTNHLIIQINDNGSGIPEDVLPHIFTNFFKADPSRVSAKGGSGLGLAIVKEIVKGHGGSVWAESTMGEGTTISFTLNRKNEGEQSEEHTHN
ncbi:HAMP domain-containing sensor histidine kinase [Bacillus gobiensis]|uniref:sensor histidine kinase n=1 Tax=Bacillus gobiensis TaxID=1441095 RepID=UPI003D21278B